jgi:exopolyphosphatase/pppGpp-phosphohydrolase
LCKRLKKNKTTKKATSKNPLWYRTIRAIADVRLTTSRNNKPTKFLGSSDFASRSIKKISKVLDAKEKLKGMTARGKRTFPKGTTRVIASLRALGNHAPPERK